MSSSPRKRRWLRLGRYLLAVLPLIWLARTVDVAQVGTAIARSQRSLLLFALAGFFASQMVGALRWGVLMRAIGVARPPRWLTLFRHVLVGLYFNALPSGLAGDAVRGFRVREDCGGLTPAYSVLFTERVCGLVGLLLIAATSFLWSRQGDGTLLVIRTMGFGAFLAVAFTLAIIYGPALLKRLPGRASPISVVRRVRSVIERLPPSPSLGSLFFAVLLSLFTQGFAVFALTLIVRSVAFEADTIMVLRAIPPIMLLCFIQLTPAAIGQRESLYVLFLKPAGVAAETALAASVLHFGLGLVVLAAAGTVYLLEPPTAGPASADATAGPGPDNTP